MAGAGGLKGLVGKQCVQEHGTLSCLVFGRKLPPSIEHAVEDDPFAGNVEGQRHPFLETDQPQSRQNIIPGDAALRELPETEAEGLDPPEIGQRTRGTGLPSDEVVEFQKVIPRLGCEMDAMLHAQVSCRDW